MKKYIIIRADDLGYSEGINYGILKTVKDGIIKTVGLMVNMYHSIQGFELIKDYNCCIGLHTNISVGKPICNPNEVQSLVDENGFFKSSKVYRNSKEEFVNYNDVYREIEAQYLRFIEIVGRKPDYFEAHAVKSEMFFKALEDFAVEYDLKYIPMKSKVDIGDKLVHMCPLNSMNKDYNAEESIKDELSKLTVGEYSTYVCHPGYLDAYVFNTSSLLEGRIKEVDMLCDKNISKWLKEYNFEIITYSDF